MKAYRAARETDDGGVGVNAALRQATRVPLGVAERATEVAQIAHTLRPITNPNMASDLTTGIALTGAAVTGALSNVEINLGSMKAGISEDDAFVIETRARVGRLEQQRG
jgi:glutamate formiminotransferase/formiminotetrahydrofolate cyclodeaminase